MRPCRDILKKCTQLKLRPENVRRPETNNMRWPEPSNRTIENHTLIRTLQTDRLLIGNIIILNSILNKIATIEKSSTDRPARH